MGDVKPKESGKRGSLLVIALTNCLDLPQAPCTGVEGLGGLRLAFVKSRQNGIVIDTKIDKVT